LCAAGVACSSQGSDFGGAGGETGNVSTAGSSNATAGSGTTPAGGSGNGTAGTGNPGGGTGSTTQTGGTGNGTGGTGNPGGGTGNNTAGTGGSGGTVPTEPCPKPEGEICHEFYANDNARNQLNYVNEFDPTKNWVKPVNDTTVNSGRQIELVDNAAVTDAGPLTGKAIMISVNKGYQEYHPITGERLANVSIGTTGVRGAVRLKNGNTILGVGDNKLRTVDKSGAIVGTECTLPGAGSDSLRVLTLDEATGNILLGRLLDLFIVSQTCQQQWTAKLPAGSKAYSVFPRAGGGVWATSGAPSTVIEFDQAGQIVSQVGGKDKHPGVGLDFFSGFERLTNGNIVAANWQGHIASPNPTTPHLVEFTPDNKLVWKWGNQDLARQITNTLILR
jgi:hypothetical protein